MRQQPKHPLLLAWLITLALVAAALLLTGAHPSFLAGWLIFSLVMAAVLGLIKARF